MNLARHAAVIWRFRWVSVGGVALGITLAVLASYSLSFSGGPKLTPRGSEVWTAVSSIHVTQPGFPEGRVTLPTTATDQAVTSDGRPAVPRRSMPSEHVEFADPGRLANLADLYAKFLASAEVLSRVPSRPKAAQIEASPFLSSTGSQVLPIIELRTNSSSEQTSRQLNRSVYDALRAVLSERQAANRISTGKRVELSLLDPPEVTLTAGRSRTMAILALLLCLVGTLAVVHLLEALRGVARPRRARTDEELAAVVPWTTTPQSEEERLERLTSSRDRALPPERQAAAGRRSTP